ncbi:hypothetical protein EOD39_12257 [Acipenser ruthenus]|uniref:Uncharacterized protein n=1 Tax=Acipenser ruthenus TaxID=7906 RepID=A0A662YU62_ACIRT|nr:hypothetical protein EOD39_12257 [Acipenser ruthenus]
MSCERIVWTVGPFDHTKNLWSYWDSRQCIKAQAQIEKLHTPAHPDQGHRMETLIEKIFQRQYGVGAQKKKKERLMKHVSSSSSPSSSQRGAVIWNTSSLTPLEGSVVLQDRDEGGTLLLRCC